MTRSDNKSVRLDAAHDDPDDPRHGQSWVYSVEDRATLLAAIERAKPGHASRMDRARASEWQPSDRDLALAAIVATGIDPHTHRTVAGSAPIAMRSDAYVTAFAMARAKIVAAPSRSVRRDVGGFVWPKGYDRTSALAALASAGLDVAANGVPMSEVADLAVLGALSMLLKQRKHNPQGDDVDDTPTDADRLQSAKELKRSDSLRDAVSDGDRERRIERRAREIAWARNFKVRQDAARVRGDDAKDPRKASAQRVGTEPLPNSRR